MGSSLARPYFWDPSVCRLDLGASHLAPSLFELCGHLLLLAFMWVCSLGSMLLVPMDRSARLGSSSSYYRAMVIRVWAGRMSPQSREVVHLLGFLPEERPPQDLDGEALLLGASGGS